MNITTASKLIDAAFEAGKISQETARQAQLAIRGSYYGMRMTADDRRRMLALRFGMEG
ncbi:hypothetical protein ISN75_06715 [Dyella marensis]|uniref:hypothetical protein n=1 Tax=Dyella marensis TaxID=500610 RepID=UPI0031D3E5AC